MYISITYITTLDVESRSSPLCKLGPLLLLGMAFAAWLAAALCGGDRLVAQATVFGLGVAAARVAQEARRKLNMDDGDLYMYIKL